MNRLITERCKIEFESSLITMNDWRAQQGYERVEDDSYDKLVSQMSPEEIERFKVFINPKHPQQDEGDISTPAVQDEGE